MNEYWAGGSINNCTFVNNEASSGSAAYLRYSGRMRNCIVWNNPTNSRYQILASSSRVSYSCVEDGSPGIGEGNITNNPQIASGIYYTLAPSSPCIDSGTEILSVAQDYLGIPRPLDGNANGTNEWDMGCYEFVSFSADSDGDTLNDQAELQVHGTNPASSDSDSDGSNDPNEIIAGTNPASPSSYLHARSEISPEGELMITWQGAANRVYSLLSTPDLAQPLTPMPLFQDIIGIEGPMSCVLSNAPPSLVFRLDVKDDTP